MADQGQIPQEPLTEREREIVALIAKGLSNQQIADQLYLTLDTVKWYNRQIFQKLGVHSRTQVLLSARQAGIQGAPAPALKHNLPEQGTPFIGREPIEQPSNAAQEVFVGREEELAQLYNYLSEVLTGQGRVAFINGTAGSGKSSLMRAFARKALVEHPDLIALDGSCSAYGGYGTPYMPFREMLNVLVEDATTQWAAGTIRHTEQPRLQGLAHYTIHLLVNQCRDLIETIVPASTLNNWARALQLDHRISLDQLKTYLSAIEMAAAPSNLEQRNLFEQYTALLHRISQRHPLLLVIDDLHWADVASISLLFHLGRQLQGKRILILGTYRTSDLTFDHHGTHHPLAPVIHEMQRLYSSVLVDLDHTLDERFVDAYLDSEPNHLDKAFRERLLQHTRGHALFTVEMVHGMKERGEIVRNAEGLWIEGHVNWGKVPERIEGLIAELLDRLPTHLRELLNVASIQGETFIAEVIAQVLGLDEHQLLRNFTADLARGHRLVVEQGVQRIGKQRFSQFRFRHLLFRTYLYRSLGEVARTYLHEMVGTKLEALCGEDTEPFTEHLAHHFQEADLREKAIYYLLHAGKRAIRLSAHKEAIAHFTQALALLDTLPKRIERDIQEFYLHIELGISWLTTRGWAAPEPEAVYARAYELAQRIPHDPDIGLALSGLYRTYAGIYGVKGELSRSLTIGEECLRLAQERNDSMLYLAAHAALGPTLYHMGQLEKGHEYAEQAGRDYEYHRRGSHLIVHGLDLSVHCLSYAGHMCWALGYPDRAVEHGRSALAIAKEQSHSFSLVVASCYLAMVYQFLGDRVGLQEHANAALALCIQYGFIYYRGWAMFLLGWASTQQGEIETGITQMEHSLQDLRTMRIGLRSTYYLVLLAEACAMNSQVEKGLSLLDDAMAWMEEHEERYHEAELHRLRGELLLQRATQSQEKSYAEAEEWFHSAVAVARRQQAKSLELRATMSLCRLWQAQGQFDLAHTRLAEIYGWFSEGFDTPDLLETKSLLAELVSQSVIDHHHHTRTRSAPSGSGCS